MSIASIISQDITKVTNITFNKTGLNAREQLIINAFENEAWLNNLPDKTNKVVEQKCIKVDRDLLFQVLMVEQISISKTAQIDDYNIKLDPKNQKVDRLRANGTAISNDVSKYKVITQLDMEDSDNFSNGANNNTNLSNNSLNNRKNTVYKITLQAKSGDIFFAINTSPLAWVSCMLGSKLIIKAGTLFNRGVFVLQESSVVFLGGINRQWNDNKETKLCAYLKAKLDQEHKANINLKGSRKRKAVQ
ncbi:hypothetical protein TPHA_0C01830 [Tetrapisispora phaffii CBS 4417]|uniref:RecQ mediated genome instability protein 1 OB-fold domain-containing protein n=1 Tax=Tetrapisispora phaffii (strain ATCC 24235 / CBS 4417 / NBRC 1672 / NRRL Y-8282 / UCD 70-5) TaxID=1071381 RepID=G8BRG3_TETPH|nr:hypothetical protein TPHA_0C01830 [Tetrapisispora phaffii CBS 4417]CCE62339.1 hypothetical protein TPHA_0C01830 [Tetrapisispora phaffii CBS 4417]